MPTEWLKVMLDEIARKRDEAALARAERERRAAEGVPAPGAAAAAATRGTPSGRGRP